MVVSRLRASLLSGTTSLSATVFLGCYYCGSATGYLVSVISPPSLSQVLGVTVIFANSMFAGARICSRVSCSYCGSGCPAAGESPTLKTMQSKVPPLCYLPSLSFMRFSLEALYVNGVPLAFESCWH